MNHDEAIEGLDYEFEDDQHHAQIMLILSPPIRTLREAQEIIESFGANIVDKKYLSSTCVVIKLDTKDVRSIALHLIEKGFNNLKGINALTTE